MIGPISPSRASYEQAAADGATRIAVSRELAWDLETPLAAFLRLGRGPRSFLLESVSEARKWARYSIVGLAPRRVIEASGAGVPGALAELDAALRAARPWRGPGGPRFLGGWVGLFGYDVARQFERLPDTALPGPRAPDLHLVETGAFLLFDRLRETVRVVVVAAPPEEAWDDAVEAVGRIVAALRGPSPDLSGLDDGPRPAAAPFESSTSPGAFRSRVERAREYIRAGDVIQVVLSQRFEAPRAGVDPVRLYRALRRINPSPYLFLLRLGEDRTLLGASPETLVRVEDGVVEVRPIAGTRPRGRDDEEDRAMEAELVADPKERAEHLMLLDLGRNDVGRVAVAGSVEVAQAFAVERYSHVMHLVSTVRGRLRPGLGPLDVLAATFPAGTLSGAPKVRAMEIIEELEGVRRGPYGGAVGYVGWDGALDLCICIRSLLATEDRLHVQAGAGVVYDSDPERERQETEHKAGALFRALVDPDFAPGP